MLGGVLGMRIGLVKKCQEAQKQGSVNRKNWKERVRLNFEKLLALDFFM
jgi:hypothetical protein